MNGFASAAQGGPSFIASDTLHNAAVQLLQARGVRLEQLAELVLFLQQDYIPGLLMPDCLESILHVLAKREVQNALLTGIQLDLFAEQGMLFFPLQPVVQADESLYGVDETLALSILNLYGSIAFTNYGYLDKLKIGILAWLNDKSTGMCHTFLDDLAGALAAAASSRLAHRYRHMLEEQSRYNR
ncbi:MAG: phosphatidylglycerophosphatase family protein [Bacilli bacterium]|nr:phosphatidylglycerophosphatase family protein [Bacilli bacterium]